MATARNCSLMDSLLSPATAYLDSCKGKFENTTCFSVNPSIMFPKMPSHPHTFISSTAAWFHLSPPAAFVFFFFLFFPPQLSSPILFFIFCNPATKEKKKKKKKKKKQKLETNAVGGDKCMRV
jgi:hypothetical protein